MKRYILYIFSFLLMLVSFASCEVEELKTTFDGKGNTSLTLRLNTNGLESRAPIAGEDANNENLIQTLDCFFYTSSDGDAVCYKRVSNLDLKGIGQHKINITFEEDEMQDLFGDDFRENGNNKTCFVYIIANRPENNDGSENNESITGSETINALKAKMLETDFSKMQNNFVMDSGAPDTDGKYVYDIITLSVQDNTASLSGHVPLYRSAAKVGLFVHVPESIEIGENENKTTWTPVAGSMSVKFHNGVMKGNIDNNAFPYDIQPDDYFETEARSFDVANSTLKDSQDNVYNHTTSVPFYTYPTSSEKGTYFILYLSWQNQTGGQNTDTKDDDTYQYKNCSYQIPINKLEVLKRNNYYRLLLNVGVLGTESGVVTLEPSYTVLNWNDENINTSIEENVYLVVQEHDVFINNKNTYSVEFASSHDIEVQILSITQPYYVSNIAGTTTFCNYEEGRGLALVESGTTGKVTIGTNTNAATQSLYRDCSVGVSGNTIVLNHEVVNMGEETVDKEYDIAPYTIVVYVKMVYGSGENDYYEDTIEFTQYPAIYVEANQNSDYTVGDSYASANNNHNMMVNSYYGGDNSDHEKEDMTSTIPVDYEDRNFDFFGSAPGLWVVENSDTNVNPNMYVIHVTSMSDNENTIGDPRETEIDDTFIESATWAMAPAIYPESPRRLTHYFRTNRNRTTNTNQSSQSPLDYITGNVIAPIIRVASSYSVTHNTNSLEMAEKRCASYQEDGYPAGRWRMPTFAEARFIYTLSWEGKIPKLFNDNKNYWCAHGDFLPNNGVVTLNPSGNASSIRCVYDEWYWGSDQITNKSTFTWGDYPRDAWPPSGN